MATSEFQTIAKIVGWLPPVSSHVEVGIGDDAAVLRPTAGKMLATVDMMVEGVHFDLAYCRPEEIGHKLLAINLSDIAAMGGVPRYALVSVALSKGTSDAFLEKFYSGLRAIAERFTVDIVGGNLTSSNGGLALDLSLIGEATEPVLRCGAQVGDLVAVTGTLGGAAAGLAALQARGESARSRFSEVTRRQLSPEPRLREGQALAPFATALIDISDGLSSELHHLAERSQCGFRIRRADLPEAKGITEVAAELGKDPGPWVLHGGEDYELLFTFAASDRERVLAAVTATVIGEVTESGISLEAADGTVSELAAQGWSHSW